jgi:uncharacterized protein YndB with AHSA1/START domain
VAHNVIEIRARPQRVFAILADPRTYPDWVVGDKAIRAVDPEFPAPGSKFHHRVGFGPLTVDDHTEVLDVQPPWRLELKGKFRPWGTARIVWLVQPHGPEGTYVTMLEGAGDLLSHAVVNPLTDPLIGARNARTLRRLKALAEDGAPAGR